MISKLYPTRHYDQQIVSDPLLISKKYTQNGVTYRIKMCPVTFLKN